MVQGALTAALQAANQAFGLIIILVSMGIWLGFQQAQVLELKTFLVEHPKEKAHAGQAEATVEFRVLLTGIKAELMFLRDQQATLKADVLTTVATKFTDDRFRRRDMAALCHELETLNKDFRCPPLYKIGGP